MKLHKVINKGADTEQTKEYNIEECLDKLSRIADGAEVNQNAFSKVAVGNTTIEADNKTDILTIEAGDNITLTPDTTNDKITIGAKVDMTALDGKLDKTGGTLTGNLTGKYITGTWLQTTEATDLGRAPGKVAVLDESGWVYYRTPAELLADIGAATVSAMLDKAYPVGSIYISVNSTNPKTLFGGTWVQIKDRFLLAAGTTYKAGATGGEATHKLTYNEMPEHTHPMYSYNPGGDGTWTPDEGSYLVDSVTDDKTTWWARLAMGYAGGGAAHNNMPPYLAVYVWKRTA